MKPNFWYDSGFWPPLLVHLENCTWKNFNPIPFLTNNNINVPIQKGSRLYEWFAAEGGICKNASISYFNGSVDNSILYAEGKVCVIIAIPSIERTFEKWPYPCITWSTKALHIQILDLKVNLFRGNNLEHDITKHLFTHDFRWCKINKIKKEETISLGSPTTR